jgi:hypothetical protein
MGHYTHRGLLVTGQGYPGIDPELAKAHALATELGNLVTPIASTGMNGYASFAVLPHGGKDYGEHGLTHKVSREALIDHLRTTRLEWVAVAYGWDDDGARVTNHPYTPDDLCPW